ncbi:ATP-binding protein [Brachybacterium sp. DNPG3]
MSRPSTAENRSYLHRYIDDELDALLPELTAVALDGPKGVGKTATASRRADAVLHLDDPSVRQLVAAGPREQLSRGSTVLVDEWQHLPEVWDVVRREVDAGNPRRYLLTGSATPQDGVDTHTGAGRIISLRMRPLSLAERQGAAPSVRIADLFTPGVDIIGSTAVGIADYAREICASGLPEVTRLSPRARRYALESYVQNVIDRDIPDQGLAVRKPATLRAWMAAYAAASSTTTEYGKILDAATAGDTDKPSKKTTLAYRDVLSKIWILDPVPAWLPTMSPLTRLVQAPKHQLADPALAATLLNVSEDRLLSGATGSGELFGNLLESLATLTVRAAGAAAEASTFHLRTRGGEHEVDLILERYDGAVVAFEVKLARTVDDHDVRHLHWLGDKLGDRLRSKVIITTGTDAFRRADGVIVVPLALLG